MKPSKLLGLALTALFAFSPLNAEELPAIEVPGALIITMDLNGKGVAYAESEKELIERIKQLDPRAQVTILNALYAGDGVNHTLFVVTHPDVKRLVELQAYIVPNDLEMQRILPSRAEKFEFNILSQSLYLDSTPR